MTIRATAALLAIAALLAAAGCGEDDEASTQSAATTSANTTSTTTTESASTTTTESASTTTTESALTPAAGVSLSSVSACLKDAGADPESPRKLGRGTGLFATLPNGTYSGVAIAPNAAVANQLELFFSGNPSYEVNTTADPKTLVIFKGDVDEEDRALMETCISGH